MLSNYVRKAGSRDYRMGYTQETLELAVKEVRQGAKVYKTAAKCGISRGTLYNKIKNSKPLGGKKRISNECEHVIIKTINTLVANYRVPFDGYDIRCQVKTYLDKKGIIDSIFNNNLP